MHTYSEQQKTVMPTYLYLYTYSFNFPPRRKKKSMYPDTQIPVSPKENPLHQKSEQNKTNKK